MRKFLFIAVLLSLFLPVPQAAMAEVRLFSGNLEVVTTSGKACAGRKGNYPISLVIGSDDTQDSVFGYVGGDKVTVGQVRGSSLASLSLRYPYADPGRAEGHGMEVEISGSALRGVLRDRHLDAAVDDCNFDLARVTLKAVDDTEAAHTTYRRLLGQYEAQLARSTGISISRSGAHADAIHVFERALAQADKLYPADSPQLVPYLTSLANAYMRAGKYLDFSNLYNSRKDSLNDDAVRSIFSHHQIRSLLQIGRAAMGREEYQTALDNFRQALHIDYKNKDAIAANMSALVRSGRHDEAIAFLEQTEQRLDSEPDRKDVREAIALVAYQKSRKEQKEGRMADAERSIRKAIKLDPGTARYVVILARMVHKAGKYTEADTILKRGLELFKDGPGRQELTEARDKLRQTEIILARIRRAGV